MRNSAMNESDVKRAMVKSMKDHNGYARRIEDQYAVGIMDMILIPLGLPVFMAEVKVVSGNVFGPTVRQLMELERIREVAFKAGHVIPVMIGCKNWTYYFHEPRQSIDCRECFSVTSLKMSFHDQLVQYYHSRRK